MIKIEIQVNSGTAEQGCTNYVDNDIITPTTEKGGHIMVNLNEGMTTKDVADILCVSERTVRNICKLKQLVHYKVGTKIVILPEDLNNYINSLKVEKE